MRRIIACVLVVAIAGLGGLGVMRVIAQPDAPALKPATYVQPKSAMPMELVAKPALKIPDIIDPLVPSVPDTIPLLAPSQPMAVAPPAPQTMMLPPAGVIKEEKPVVLPAPELTIPAVDPSPGAVKAPAMLPPTDIKPETPAAPSLIQRIKPEATVTAAPTSNRVMPSVSIEAIAPETAPYGQPVSYEIVVKNNGAATVANVRVDDEITGGTKFMSAEPTGEINGDKVMWLFGTLNAGEEKHIKMTVRPGEGDLASKPRVTYSAATTMNVQVTRPSLAVTVNASEVAQVGDEIPVQIQVTNTGTGEATRVVLKAVLTDGLKHGEGNDIQALLNKLAPGESQVVTLRVQAAMAGAQSCSMIATTEGTPKVTAQAKIDIRQPKLTLGASGPAKCVVRAEPTFTLEVANPGTSATEPVQLAVAFPEGLDFLSASDGGAYDPATRTVSWTLGVAAAGTKRNLTVKAKSTVAGNLAVRAVAQAGSKLNARAEAVLQADGVPALLFEVVDHEDPIEVGKESTYEIRLSNTGTMHCTNVKLTAALSDGLQPTQVSSNLPYKIVGQTMVFEPIAKLAVKADLIVRIKAKGATAGDHRFKVQLACDQMKQPVVKEESTSFYQP